MQEPLHTRWWTLSAVADLCRQFLKYYVSVALMVVIKEKSDSKQYTIG